MKIIFLIFVFLVLLAGVIFVILIIWSKHRKKYRILEVNGKYVPMIEGGRYLYADEKTGILMSSIGDQYMLIDTEEDAKKCIDDYHKQLKQIKR